MTRFNRILKNKHYEIIAWAVRFDGTTYVATIIRNEHDLSKDKINFELNEALNDLSVERIELVPARKCSDGARRAAGKPVHVIVGA